MPRFNGTRVSWPHKVILDEGERRDVVDRINSGQRTPAEQQELVDEKGLFHPVLNPHGAAPVNRNAPHIKAGRLNHAIDDNDGESDRLAAFYRSLGVRGVVFNVPSEPWHIDFLDEASLVRVASSLREIGGLLVTLRPGMVHSDVRVLRYWLTDTGDFERRLWHRFRRDRKYGPNLRRAVRRFQRRAGLHVDGVVGPRTWRVLERWAKNDKELAG